MKESQRHEERLPHFPGPDDSLLRGLLRRGRADRPTCAVYSFLPDPAYDQELIERRRAEVEPDIPLVRAEWNCYEDGAPEGIDVIMFDAVMLDSLAASGWIQPISPNQVRNTEDIFPFALEGLTVEGRLYGIPVFLCGNFLIYDQTCRTGPRSSWSIRRTP